MKIRAPSIKFRFGFGAALVGLIAVLSAGLVVVGMNRVGDRVDDSIRAEQRIDRYSVLFSHFSSFVAVATEAIRRDLSTELRAERLASSSRVVTETFALMHADLRPTPYERERLTPAEETRRSAQSLAIAQMEVYFNDVRNDLSSGDRDREELQGLLNVFVFKFEPLINATVSREVEARDRLLESIGDLRRSLVPLSLAMAMMAILLVAGIFFGLVRPQLRRLETLGDAAERIGRQDFSVSLPESEGDEIGRLFAATNRMASALGARQDEVEREWHRLNETIEERTHDLRQANAALARTDEQRRRFFADVSHELRMPLTMILMEAQLARKGSSEIGSALDTIESRALRLNRRIDDLLRVARSESGLLELKDEPYELEGVLAEVIGDMTSEAETAGMTLTASPVPAMTCLGDANWIRQVMTGLIQNAIRHARSGGAIAIRAERKNSGAAIRIVDNGPGIDEAEQAVVFERFGKGSGEARSEGFGIGIALARWVLEEQGGSIALESPVPEGDRIGDAPGTSVLVCIPEAPR